MQFSNHRHHEFDDLLAVSRDLLGAIIDPSHAQVSQLDEILVSQGGGNLVTKLHHAVVDVVEGFRVFLVPCELGLPRSLAYAPDLILLKGFHAGQVVGFALELDLRACHQFAMLGLQIDFLFSHLHDLGVEGLHLDFQLIEEGGPPFICQLLLERGREHGLFPAVVDFFHGRQDRVIIFLLCLGLLVEQVPLEVQVGHVEIGNVFLTSAFHFLDHGDLLVRRVGVVESLQSFVQQVVLLLDRNSFIGIVAVFHFAILTEGIPWLASSLILERFYPQSSRSSDPPRVALFSRRIAQATRVLHEMAPE